MSDLAAAYQAQYDGHSASGRVIADDLQALPEEAYLKAYGDAHLAKYGNKPPEVTATEQSAAQDTNTPERLVKSAGEGVARSVWELGRTVRDSANALDEFINASGHTTAEQKAQALQDYGAMPDLVKDKSLAENLVSGSAQFLAPFMAFNKAMAGAKVFDAIGRSKLGASILQGGAASAPVDFAFIDPIQNNLVDVAKQFGFESDLTNFLASSPEQDNGEALTNRLKAVLTNAPVGVVAGLGIDAAVKGFVLAAKGVRAVSQFAGEVGPVGLSAQRGGAPSIPTNQIPRSKELDSASRDVETRLANAMAANPKQMERTYNAIPDTQGGKILSVDDARRLSPDYNASMDARTSQSPSVHEPASWFIKRLFEQKLKALPEGDHVMFLSGGTGAGKTSALKMVPAAKMLGDEANFIYDTNFQSVAKASQKIDKALKAGANVDIVHVVRDPVEALLNGSVPRMQRSGRSVPLSAHTATHEGSAAAIQELAAKYKGDKRVSITIIDNRGGVGGAKQSTLDAVRETDYTQLASKLAETLKGLLDKGVIDGKQYRAMAR